MKKPKILVVGSINYDFIYHNLLEEGINDNGMVFAQYTTGNGGKGANQAAALALLGANSFLAGSVGNDEYGRNQIDSLRKSGVNTDFIQMNQTLQTGMSVMLNRNNGSYIGANVLGANASLSPDLVENIINNHSFDMVIMQLEMPLETVYRTYETAKNRNIPVILDAGPAKSIPLERLKGIFIITPNEEETQALTGISVDCEENARKASRKLHKETNAQYIVLKLGSRGSYLYDGLQGILFPPYPTLSVDSTAAGDSFTAELAIRLCRNDSITHAIKYANAAGAICVSRPGGQLSVPSESEVEQFVKQNTDNYKNNSKEGLTL